MAKKQRRSKKLSQIPEKLYRNHDNILVTDTDTNAASTEFRQSTRGGIIYIHVH
jgi:hypothetical protein